MLQQTVLLSALMLALATPLASAQQEQPADSTTAGSTTTGPTTMSPSQMGPGMGPGKMGPGMRSGQMRPGGQDGPGMIDDAESDTSMSARWEAIQKHMEDIAATDDPAQRRELMQKYRKDMRQFMTGRGGPDGSQRGMMHRSGPGNRPGNRPGDGTGQKHGYGHSDRHSNRHAQGHYMGPGAMAYPYMMPPMPMMVMPPMNMMGGPGMMCNPYMMPPMYMPPMPMMPMMNMMPPMHRSGMQGGPQGQQLDSRLQLIEERLDELQILLEERLDDDNSDD